MELRRHLATTLAALFLLPVAAGHAAVSDVPIGGRLVRLRASQSNPERRNLTFHSALDAAIAPPFPNPLPGNGIAWCSLLPFGFPRIVCSSFRANPRNPKSAGRNRQG